MLEATAFGVGSSYILIGSKPILPRLNAMVHEISGICMRELLTGESRNTTASEVRKVRPLAVHWQRSQAADGSWGGNIYSRGTVAE